MKKSLVIALAILIALAVVTPVLAAWEEKITGSMEDSSNWPGLSVQLSAWSNGDGTYGGNGEYYYAGNGNQFHLDVQKVCTRTIDGHDIVVAVGKVNVQAGFASTTNEWGLIGVWDGGEFQPDRVRALVNLTEATALSYCETSNSFPAIVSVGDFKLRSK